MAAKVEVWSRGCAGHTSSRLDRMLAPTAAFQEKTDRTLGSIARGIWTGFRNAAIGDLVSAFRWSIASYASTFQVSSAVPAVLSLGAFHILSGATLCFAFVGDASVRHVEISTGGHRADFALASMRWGRCTTAMLSIVTRSAVDAFCGGAVRIVLPMFLVPVTKRWVVALFTDAL